MLLEQIISIRVELLGSLPNCNELRLVCNLPLHATHNALCLLQILYKLLLSNAPGNIQPSQEKLKTVVHAFCFSSGVGMGRGEGGGGMLKW